MPVTALINRKGGVGKTTLTLALADFLAARHALRVLVIDLDPQANSTLEVLGEDFWYSLEKRQRTLADLFSSVREGRVINATALVQPAKNMVVDNFFGTLDLLPASPRILDEEEELASDGAWRYLAGSPLLILHQALKDIVNTYDHVLIDCPPSLGVVTMNGLLLSDGFLVPTIPDHVSTVGIGQVLLKIREQFKAMRRKISYRGLVLNRYDRQTRLHNAIAEELRAKAEYAPVWDTFVPRTVRAEEGHTRHVRQTLASRYGGASNPYFIALESLAGEFRRRVG
jgi:chromosome partitioning protein